MPPFLEIDLHGERLVLLPQRALWWPAQRALVVSDVHAGKAAHFRKAGLPVPRTAFEADLARLDALVRHWQPAQLIATGDLFHSAHNREIDTFGAWRAQAGVHVRLVRGNHDVLGADAYARLGLEVVDQLALPPFCFRHHPPRPDERETLYALTGHLHPGVELRGPARQQLRLPCFYFAGRYAVLPAFSRLTGLALLRPGAGDRVDAIVGEERVLKLGSFS